MTTGPTQDPQDESGRSEGATPLSLRRMPLPGAAAIAFYLLLIAATTVTGVVQGHFPPLYLLFSMAFITAGGGLLASFRWAWSLALAAVFSLAAYWAWTFSLQHTLAAAVQGLFNLLFFLYLIRPEVRARMR
jgi:hypothetical protein